MELTAADYAAVIRRRFVVIAVVACVFNVLALALQSTVEPTYSATTELFLNPIIDPISNTPQVSKRDTLVNMDTEQRLATSIEVASRVREAMDIEDESARALRSHVATTAVPETELLRITYKASEPEVATDRSLAWANEYLALRRQRVLETRADSVDSLQLQIDDATNELAELAETLSGLAPDSPDRFTLEARREQKQRLLASLQDSLVTVTSASTLTGNVVNAPSSAKANRPFGSREMAAVLIVGLIVGVALAFVIDRSDRRIRSVDEVALQGLPVLADFRKASYDAAVANRMRSMLSSAERRPFVMLVASPDDSGAAAFVGVALGRAFAAADLDVGLIATDAEQPEAERLLGIPGSPGFADVIAGEAEMESVVRTVETPAGRLAVVGSGKRDRWRPGLLARRDVHDLLGRVAANVDVLIIVCPPVETSSVAFDLASVADEGVVAVRRGVTTATALARNVAELRTLDVQIVGAVLVGRK